MRKRKAGFLPVFVPNERRRAATQGNVSASSSGPSATSSSSALAQQWGIPDAGELSYSQVENLIALGLLSDHTSPRRCPWHRHAGRRPDPHRPVRRHWQVS